MMLFQCLFLDRQLDLRFDFGANRLINSNVSMNCFHIDGQYILGQEKAVPAFASVRERKRRAANESLSPCGNKENHLFIKKIKNAKK